MPNLPRVAILGAGMVGAAALAAMYDGGLVATAYDTTGEATGPGAAAYLERFGLTEHVRFDVGAVTVEPLDAGRWPFAITAGDGQAQSADVIVHTEPVTPTTRLFRGVFNPDVEAVYLVGSLDGARPLPAGTAASVAEAQGKLIGEYLRGRYLLPTRSEMIADIDATDHRRRKGTAPDIGAYLTTLPAELKRGHARAQRASYPLPVPRREPAATPPASPVG